MNEAVTGDVGRIDRRTDEGTTGEDDGVGGRQGREVERSAHARGTVVHSAAREDIRDLIIDTVNGNGTRAERSRITGRRDAGVDDRAASVGVSRGKG